MEEKEKTKMKTQLVEKESKAEELLVNAFNSLLAARSEREVAAVLRSLGDSPAEAQLDVPFGPAGLIWRPVGGNPSNFSTIGLATKPGKALVERITNATDAQLELRVKPGLPLPSSPRDAAKQWFGRPLSGPDEGLFNWRYRDLDEKISVVLRSGDEGSAPTIDVIDQGIGISPEDFAATILSLQGGNKISKWHLIGAFGQGGAASLAFSKYTIIFSRSFENPRECGFTIIRVLKLPSTYKEDCYAYLALPGGPQLVRRGPRMSAPVPSVDIGPAPITFPETNVPKMKYGTIVRHVGYEAEGLAGKLWPAAGNLYHYFQAHLFDTLLPFRVYDLRDSDPAEHRDEVIGGSRNRLMKLQISGPQGHTEVRHYRPMEYVVPLGFAEPSIGVEYWVVYSQKKTQKGYVLRAQSNELFVDPGFPIVGTNNGQVHGQLPARLLREMGLALTSRHIVVHLDLTLANTQVKRELLSTTRENFRESPTLTSLLAVLKKMLEEDVELQNVERELVERIASREAKATNTDVKKMVRRLLLEAGLAVSEETGGPERTPRNPGDRPKEKYKLAEPLPVLPYPEVSKWEIVNPKDELSIRVNDTASVTVETDAHPDFDREAKALAIRSEPALLEIVSKAPLKGGRVRWRLRPVAGAEPGATCRVIATLTLPNGTQCVSEVPATLREALQDVGDTGKGFVPDFRVTAISPHDSPEQWLSVWPSLDDTSDPEKIAHVAFRQVLIENVLHVFYSSVFGPYEQMRAKAAEDSPLLAQLFETQYEGWIVYYAILQQRQTRTSDIDSDDIDTILEDERTRFATVQARQAFQWALAQQKLLKAKAARNDSEGIE